MHAVLQRNSNDVSAFDCLTALTAHIA